MALCCSFASLTSRLSVSMALALLGLGLVKDAVGYTMDTQTNVRIPSRFTPTSFVNLTFSSLYSTLSYDLLLT